jgi:hypothetical protein
MNNVVEIRSTAQEAVFSPTPYLRLKQANGNGDAAAGAPGRGANGGTHLLLAIREDKHFGELISALPSDLRITRLDPEVAVALPRASFEIAVLHTTDLGTWIRHLTHDADAGCPEVVFVVDEADSPERLAFESLGFRYVVPLAQLPVWLPGALTGLCALSAARRALAEARANAPEPPLRGRAQLQTPIHLHAAETRFRETFLRLLLAHHGSRRKAAVQAGVPYRSFCEMLRKLDI